MPAGFNVVGLDDSAWPAVTEGGLYGVMPWGDTVVSKA
jgi:hypothetical protein